MIELELIGYAKAMPTSDWVKSAQRRLGAKLIQLTQVAGGDINEAYRLTLSDGRVIFAKVNQKAPPGLFYAESESLRLLCAASSGLVVPRVIEQSDQYLLLEYLETSCVDQCEEFGQGLAALHQPLVNCVFGAEFDGFIGTLPQQNVLEPERARHLTWLDFFVQFRLEPQLRLPKAQGLISAQLRKDIARLLEFAGRFFPNHVLMSRVHGDLWSGNFMFTERGPAIFDPASYFAHREVDLAMMTLFGGFPPRIFDSYFEVLPREAGYNERRLFYQLYPLLVHVNLFGQSYVEPIAGIVKQLG